MLMEVFPGRFLTEIAEEVNRLPVGLLSETLEARAYKRAKELVDAADTAEKAKALPHDRFVEMVKEIGFED